MHWNASIVTILIGLAGVVPPAIAQQGAAALAPALPGPNDPIKVMIDRLSLEKYKATIKGLTQFGDRRQGTERNRNAIGWIEAQLQSYGCTNTERSSMNTIRLQSRQTAGSGREAPVRSAPVARAFEAIESRKA